MEIVIVGLGLIGGSLAKALKQNTSHRVLGMDVNDDVLLDACSCGAIDGKAALSDLERADVVYLCLYPEDILDFVRSYGSRLKPGCVLTDACGIKQEICAAMEELSQNAPYQFVAGHPMAGKERGGFTASTEDLYVGASMILTPDKRTDMRLLETLKAFFLDLGFAGLTFSTPEEHDRIIAFTSQLAHIVSSAYVKSPEAQKRRGFSAGSFQDMTRVARLNEDMWTELFLDDEDFLTKELDELIGHLTDYRNALRDKDAQRLHDLLKEGRELKATAGGN